MTSNGYVLQESQKILTVLLKGEKAAEGQAAEGQTRMLLSVGVRCLLALHALTGR
jgi:hypothetical protein